MRLFVAIDLEDDLRGSIATYIREIQHLAPDARWATPESLHITLKFIGERPEGDIENFRLALASIRSAPILLRFRGYGFFPHVKRPIVFWLGIEAPPALALLADQVGAALGLPREEHPYMPHLTLARTGSGAPRFHREPAATPSFHRLQEKLSTLPLPDFGTMTAREFFLYQSKLSPEGSHYMKLASYNLDLLISN